MEKELKHFGIPGMRWGVRRAKSNTTRNTKTKRAEALVSKHFSKKATDLVNETNSESFGEKLARAYSFKKDPRGNYTPGYATFPKILVTAIVADYAQATVRNVISSGVINPYTVPRWVGSLAWTFGKVKSNTPL